MCKSFFVLIVGLFLNGVTSFNPMLTYTIRFKNLTMYPNISGEITIDQFREKQFINGNVTIDTKLYINRVDAVFYRCKPEGIDCEYFQTWKLEDLCTKLKEKNQIWSSWYGAYYPPVVCPLNKIKYTIRNATIDVGPALIIYADAVNFQWRVVQKMYAGNEFVGSYTLVVEFFGYRKRNKPIFKI